MLHCRPGDSPDMSPIEHIWDYIDRQIVGVNFKNIEELLERIRVEWNSIPIDFIEKLVESMPRRIKALIKAKGGATRY